MGGFNQRVSRLLSQKYRTYKYVSRGNMLDCDILEDFFSMTVNLKEYLLEKSELKVEQLKEILKSIWYCMLYSSELFIVILIKKNNKIIKRYFILKVKRVFLKWLIC